MSRAGLRRFVRAVRHRIRQTIVLCRVRVTPADHALAGRHLSAAEFALWRRMSAADQAHSARVLRRLLAAGERDPVLLKAALLHDVGKGTARVTIPHRIALVLLQAAGEPWLSRFARADGPIWGQELAVLRRHAAIGADLTRAAASEEAVVLLVARHDGPVGEDARLQRLRWADRE